MTRTVIKQTTLDIADFDAETQNGYVNWEYHNATFLKDFTAVEKKALYVLSRNFEVAKNENYDDENAANPIDTAMYCINDNFSEPDKNESYEECILETNIIKVHPKFIDAVYERACYEFGTDAVRKNNEDNLIEIEVYRTQSDIDNFTDSNISELIERFEGYVELH